MCAKSSGLYTHEVWFDVWDDNIHFVDSRNNDMPNLRVHTFFLNFTLFFLAVIS